MYSVRYTRVYYDLSSREIGFSAKWIYSAAAVVGIYIYIRLHFSIVRTTRFIRTHDRHKIYYYSRRTLSTGISTYGVFRYDLSRDVFQRTPVLSAAVRVFYSTLIYKQNKKKNSSQYRRKVLRSNESVSIRTRV